MTSGSRYVAAAAAVMLTCGVGANRRASAQSSRAPAPGRPLMVEDVFTNVQALRGIGVDDFMLTMGIMSAAVGSDCVGCHPSAGTDHVDWALDTPRKRTARRMVQMVAEINRVNFNGRQVVTCWTCHRGQTTPPTLPDSAWQSIRDQHVGEFTSPNAALAMSVYSASLGVECSHCHEPGSFTAPTKPAYGMVAKMLPIFDEIPKHFEQSRMPNTQCYMCHQGKRIPERRPK